MKKLIYLPLIAGIMISTSCSENKKESVSSGFNTANLDTTVAPGHDFYQYATGGWSKANPLKPEYARFGTFDLLRENNKEQLRSLIDELSKTTHPDGSIPQKIADLYNLGLDSTRLNKEGIAPLKAQLDEIAQATPNNFTNLIAKMQRNGQSPFFHFFVEADMGNSSMNIAMLYQGGLGMDDRDYYLLNDKSNTDIRDAYQNYVVKLFKLAGYNDEQANAAKNSVMKIETTLAKASFSREQLRDPKLSYNKITMEELKQKAPAIDWANYTKAIGLPDIKNINVCQVSFMQEVSKLIAATTVDDMKNYLTFNLLNSATAYLSDDFVNTSFDFYGKVMSGKKEQQPRWKRSLETTNGSLGEPVGQMYVEKYFPAKSKERMLTLVANLQKSLGQRIDELQWMGDSTKQKAKEKLSSFIVKIGYPDKWRNYTGLTIDKKDSYWANVSRSANFEWEYMISQCDKPVDKAKWGMTPQTVNAYYNPSTNEICFPAGILQPPFFDVNADDAVNYGAIGVVIGHEMTHGFDDQGRQYDKEGNLKDWWTATDAKKFEERTKGLVNQYDNIVVLDTVHANGAFTLGENIADQGGLLVSYNAFKQADKDNKAAKIDGFTPAQRFFLAYATLWAGNIRNEEILRLTKIDPHSLGKWRVNAALPNVDAFYEAFNIQPTDKMYLAPEKRVVIW